MKLVVKKTKTGKGVFAGGRIEKGTAIRVMSGSKMPWAQVEPLIVLGVLAVDDPLQIGEDEFVVLDSEPRYFNHSCNPNAGVGKGNMLCALRAIEKGEEITYDYSTVVCTHCDWNMACACDYFLCRGVVGNVATIPKARLKKYIELGVLPAFIRKELSI